MGDAAVINVGAQTSGPAWPRSLRGRAFPAAWRPPRLRKPLLQPEAGSPLSSPPAFLPLAPRIPASPEPLPLSVRTRCDRFPRGGDTPPPRPRGDLRTSPARSGLGPGGVAGLRPRPPPPERSDWLTRTCEHGPRSFTSDAFISGRRSGSGDADRSPRAQGAQRTRARSARPLHRGARQGRAAAPCHPTGDGTECWAGGKPTASPELGSRGAGKQQRQDQSHAFLGSGPCLPPPPDAG